MEIEPTPTVTFHQKFVINKRAVFQCMKLFVYNVGRNLPVPVKQIVKKLLAIFSRVQKEQYLVGFSKKTIRRAINRLNALSLFRSEDYLRINPDISKHDLAPDFHVLYLGCWEGRMIFQREWIAKILEEKNSQKSCLNNSNQIPQKNIVDMSVPIGIYISSLGNVFMEELANDVVNSLRNCGANVGLYNEFSSIENRPPICIFFAPQEFFKLGTGKRWLRDDILSQSFVFTVEQVQSPWFRDSLPFILLAKGVIDLVAQSVDLFQHASIPALHFEPVITPYEDELTDRDYQHPLFQSLPLSAKKSPSLHTPLNRRPIDVSFFGTISEKRELFFAQNAKKFSSYNTFLYIRKEPFIITNYGQDSALTRLVSHVAGHSKISLNIHRDKESYFEWHRMVRAAMRLGSVLVSEPCPSHPIYKPGIHYFEESSQNIAQLVEWLIHSNDGQQKAEKIRQQAFQALTQTTANNYAAEKRLLAFLHAKETEAYAN